MKKNAVGIPVDEVIVSVILPDESGFGNPAEISQSGELQGNIGTRRFGVVDLWGMRRRKRIFRVYRDCTY